MRIHAFENSRPNIDMTNDFLTEEDYEEMKNIVLIDPIRVRTVFADGYYLFNGKKFSYAQPTTIQCFRSGRQGR